MTPPHDLIKWFRHEWEAEMGDGRIHVHLTDAGGVPEWSGRFKALIQDELRGFPMRYALRYMSRRGTRNHRRARFLFVLACQDFDVEKAAMICYPQTYAESPARFTEWAERHTARCLKDLAYLRTDPERTYDDGNPRTFVEKRISKSEAQHKAEEAA